MMLALPPMPKKITIKHRGIPRIKEPIALVHAFLGCFCYGGSIQRCCNQFYWWNCFAVNWSNFKSDFKDLKYVIQDGTVNGDGVIEGEAAIMWGEFLTYVIDFLIVAFVMFLVIKGINTLKRKEEETPSGPSDNELLSEIRDLLKKWRFFYNKGEQSPFFIFKNQGKVPAYL